MQAKKTCVANFLTALHLSNRLPSKKVVMRPSSHEVTALHTPRIRALQFVQSHLRNLRSSTVCPHSWWTQRRCCWASAYSTGTCFEPHLDLWPAPHATKARVSDGHPIRPQAAIIETNTYHSLDLPTSTLPLSDIPNEALLKQGCIGHA
eukprot:4045875-Amphidinium_carterae.1